REPDRRVPRALGVRVAAGRSQRPPAPRGGGPRPPHRSPALSSAEPIPPRSAVRTAAVPARTLRATEVVARALERIERTDRALCAIVEVWREEALRRAGEVDARVRAGERSPPAGVPIAVKGRHGLLAASALVGAGCVAVGATSVPGPGTPWRTWGLGARGRTVDPWRPDRTPGRLVGRVGGGRGDRAGPAGDRRRRGGVGAEPGGVVRGAGPEGDGRPPPVPGPPGPGGPRRPHPHGCGRGGLVARGLRRERDRKSVV